MPPIFVIPATLCSTLAGLVVGALLPLPIAAAVIIGFGLAVIGLVRTFPVALMVGVMILATIRIAAPLASARFLPEGSDLEFSGVVAGVRTEPYAVVRLFTPEDLSGNRLRIAFPADHPAHPGDRVSGWCRTGSSLGNPIRWKLERIVATCWRSKIVAQDPGGGILKPLARIREGTAARIRLLYPEPSGDFLEGILVGSPPSSSPDLTATLRRAGVSHLVAVSGYNLTIIVGALGAFVFPLLGRRMGTVGVALGLIAFSGISGFEGSVLRAAAMSLLQLAAYLIGRPAALPRVLTIAVLIAVWVSPGLVLFDLGFQLSVAATAGIAFLSGPIARRIGVLPEAGGLKTSVATSLAALVATAPVLALAVGRVSLVAPLSTVLLTPLVPPAMLTGALSLLPIPGVSELLVAITRALLETMIAVARMVAQLPFAAVDVPAMVPILALVVAAMLAFILRRKPSPRLPGWGAT